MCTALLYEWQHPTQDKPHYDDVQTLNWAGNCKIIFKCILKIHLQKFLNLSLSSIFKIVKSFKSIFPLKLITVNICCLSSVTDSILAKQCKEFALVKKWHPIQIPQNAKCNGKIVYNLRWRQSNNVCLVAYTVVSYKTFGNLSKSWHANIIATQLWTTILGTNVFHFHFSCTLSSSSIQQQTRLNTSNAPKN